MRTILHKSNSTFKIIKIVLIFIFLSTSNSYSKNTTIKNLISEYLANQHQEQLQLLQQLVNINSGTTNLLGVHQVGNILLRQFAELGFTVHWVEEPSYMGRAGALIAERHGDKGKRLLLIGHLDTVFPVISPFRHFKQTGDLATGPGVIDDKGGAVVILYALKALNQAGALNDVNITVVLTGDEEDSGKPISISRKALIDAAKKADIALDFEWAITPNTATIARRGISSWVLKTEGTEAHSSEIFQKKAGFGAIFELARIIDAMRITLAHEKYLSFNPGIILGGTTIDYDKTNAQGMASGKTNVIAKTAFAKGDLRFLTEQQKIATEKTMVAIAASHLPGTNAILSFEEGIPAMPPTTANRELLKLYSQASISLGYGEIKELDPGSRGAGDISHIASFVSASLVGLGPVGTGAHSDKETLVISSLSMQSQRAALLIYWLTKGNEILSR